MKRTNHGFHRDETDHIASSDMVLFRLDMLLVNQLGFELSGTVWPLLLVISF